MRGTMEAVWTGGTDGGLVRGRRQAGHQANEVDEAIRELKSNPGFSSYMIMNNDGEPPRLCVPMEPLQGLGAEVLVLRWRMQAS